MSHLCNMTKYDFFIKFNFSHYYSNAILFKTEEISTISRMAKIYFCKSFVQ